MSAATCVYVRAEIGGIQNYICSTGKLRQMIGGSEIIRYLTDKFYMEKAIEPLHLQKRDQPDSGENWFIPVQASAGIVCVIVANERIAASFLELLSRSALEYFPGLPLYGARHPMTFERSAYREARREADRKIGEQRSQAPVGQGMPMLPIAVSSRLDGLPACEKDPEPLSLPSVCRSESAILEMSRKRLRNYIDIKPWPGIGVRWADDLEEMLKNQGGEGFSRVALIRMDGNDLGKLFREKLEQASGQDLAQGIANMRDLSQKIDDATTQSFKYAATAILGYILAKNYSDRPMMPLRPLVIGGDDITVIIRADLALMFIQRFARRFEELSGEYLGRPLSLGIGMVAMNKSWPFTRAFALAESLLENAKAATLNMGENRPSSLDYISITEEVESDISHLRQRLFTARSGELLTAKPLLLQAASFNKFLRDGQDIAGRLSRSLIRGAWTETRKGRKAAAMPYANLKDNLARGIGGRAGIDLLPLSRFLEIFPESFFEDQNGAILTRLGDFLELEKLLPANPADVEYFMKN